MKETLHCSNGLDETRVRRAFNWVVTFRDFPVGSYQTVDGDSMMTEALTLFTKGRAEFYLDGERRGDRLPGILSSEHEVVGQGGTFTLKYVEPTTRVCIPYKVNKQKLPEVRKVLLEKDQLDFARAGERYLVCLGSVQVNGKIIKEESTFKLSQDSQITALEPTILLEFLT